MNVLLAFALATADTHAPEPVTDNGWSIVTKVSMDAAPGENGQIWNEMAKADGDPMKKGMLLAQIVLTRYPHVEFILLARNCYGAVDYRQQATMARGGNVTEEIFAINTQAQAMFEVVEKRCDLPVSAGTQFMSGFETVYRDLYRRERSGNQ